MSERFDRDKHSPIRKCIANSTIEDSGISLVIPEFRVIETGKKIFLIKNHI